MFLDKNKILLLLGLEIFCVSKFQYFVSNIEWGEILPKNVLKLRRT